MNEALPSQRIVLLGIGHTNAHVLRMWRMNAPDGVGLTCISDHPIATYSGMLPAVLAGQQPVSAMQIDLVRLCASVGAQLILDRVKRVDAQSQVVHFHERPPLSYDALSIGIGSVATKSEISLDPNTVVEIKPMQTFLNRLGDALELAVEERRGQEVRIAVVGSGVAGIEIACCLRPFLEKRLQTPYRVRIVTRSSEILPDLDPKTRARVQKALSDREIEISSNATVAGVIANAIQLSDGTMLNADLVVWSTGASPPDLLNELGLATDPDGFLATNASLQSLSSSRVFAVGDTGTIEGTDVPKAGVYAVRQGPILWENLQRLLVGAPLQRYRPQHSFLKLINFGDGSALGQWKGMCFSGRWVMRLKESIDLGFMEKFRVIPMEDEQEEMQCRGCGCKVGADLLQTALPAAGEIKLEDAAEIGQVGSTHWVASTDFFSSPFDDAYLTGRVAALHSASDILASGAKPSHALSNIVLPEGPTNPQREVLRDILAGARREFDALGASIVGGHTIEGPRMEIGFTVIGESTGELLISKSNLKSGDGLYLTKPIGIGVLLASHMRSACKAEDYVALLEAILQPQDGYARVAVEKGVTAGTDITGFGLAGHLLEMLDSSDLAAALDLDQVPLLPGSADAVRSGITSSLAPANRVAAARIETDAKTRKTAKFDLLFDPQTCGGLLFGVSRAASQSFLDACCELGLETPTRIGEVVPRDGSLKPLCVNGTATDLITH